jgi:hypothetical protein
MSDKNSIAVTVQFLLLIGGAPFVLVKLNIVNLNRQAKMYSQGMTPVFRMVPGRSHWERIKEKPSYIVCTCGREKDLGCYNAG